MRDYLKGASVIHQCTRCYSLRDNNGTPCAMCLTKLQEVTTTTQPLPFGDISDDSRQETLFVCGVSGDFHA